MNALSDYLMKSGREEAGVLLGAYGMIFFGLTQMRETWPIPRLMDTINEW